MKIADLPPGLRELAEERVKRHWWHPHYTEKVMDFHWKITPEGDDYWLEINRGNFTPYYNCRVVNFKSKNL